MDAYFLQDSYILGIQINYTSRLGSNILATYVLVTHAIAWGQTQVSHSVVKLGLCCICDNRYYKQYI